MTQQRDHLTHAVSIVGDAEIARILKQDAAAIYPAYSCYYDGFVDDVFSEYTNPSIGRPASVRRAGIQSELRVNLNHGGRDRCVGAASEPVDEVRRAAERVCHLPEPGEYYIGWTMYETSGASEGLTVWLGAREVAHVPSRGGNRLRLTVLEQPFHIDYGERLRLVTEANDSLYRLEKVVLLRSLPGASERELRIGHISAEMERGSVRLNWRTDRVTTCTVHAGAGEVIWEETVPLANHSALLPDVAAEDTFEIRAGSAEGERATSGPLRMADLLPARGEQSESGRVALAVVNRLDREALGWPVTWGVPLPRGALWDLARCRLVEVDGRALACQKEVQVTWDDGSVRWALLDFQVDLPPGERAALSFEYGPDVSDEVTGGAMAVSTDREGVTVDAGALRLAFARRGYTFPAAIELRGPEGWVAVHGAPGTMPAIELVDGEGTRYLVSDLDELEVETTGPMRTTLRLVARHRAADGSALMRSILRVTAYRDRPYLRVQHTWENDDVDRPFTRVRSLRLGAPLVPDWLAQASIGSESYPLDGEAVHLLQPTAGTYEVRQAEAVRDEGEHAPAWWAASGPAGAAAVAMRDFWQNYPKGWAVGPGGLWVDICPDVSSIDYPGDDVLEVVRTSYYLQEGGYKLKQGMARTHDMLFVLGEEVGAAEEAVRLFGTPPLVRLELDQFERAGVLGGILPRGTPEGERYDRWCDEALQVYEQDRRETGAYGMLNFGDWYGERLYNWGNMEYDTPYGFLIEYLRGGADRCFDLGWQAAWHLADVDTCHHHADPGRAGRQYGHSLGHVGDYYPDGYLPMSIARAFMSWTHTWVEGLYLYALLTGERRLWEVATRAVETLAAGDVNDYDFTNCRDCGWPLRHLIGSYQATGAKRFLNAAWIIVERVLERQRPSGGWERLLVPGHCFHVPPRHMGNAGFMVGILLAALKRVHEGTGDQAVGQAIVDGARYVVQNLWEDDVKAFRYTSCPDSHGGGSLNAQILEGIGYAWALSGDEALGETLRSGLDYCLVEISPATSPPVGKDVSTRLRSMPFIMRRVRK